MIHRTALLLIYTSLHVPIQPPPSSGSSLGTFTSYPSPCLSMWSASLLKHVDDLQELLFIGYVQCCVSHLEYKRRVEEEIAFSSG